MPSRILPAKVACVRSARTWPRTPPGCAAKSRSIARCPWLASKSGTSLLSLGEIELVGRQLNRLGIARQSRGGAHGVAQTIDAHPFDARLAAPQLHQRRLSDGTNVTSRQRDRRMPHRDDVPQLDAPVGFDLGPSIESRGQRKIEFSLGAACCHHRVGELFVPRSELMRLKNGVDPGIREGPPSVDFEPGDASADVSLGQPAPRDARVDIDLRSGPETSRPSRGEFERAAHLRPDPRFLQLGSPRVEFEGDRRDPSREREVCFDFGSCTAVVDDPGRVGAHGVLSLVLGHVRASFEPRARGHVGPEFTGQDLDSICCVELSILVP